MQASAPKLVIDNDPLVGGLTVAQRRMRDSASYINRRIANMKAGQAWLDVGRELAELKSFLKKHSKNDRRDGWLAAFKGNAFPFGRRHADRLIEVHEKIGGHECPPTHLPASCTALFALAKIPDSYRKKVMERCSPGITETEVKSFARQLDVPIVRHEKSKRKKKLFQPTYEAFKKLLSGMPEQERVKQYCKLATDLGIQHILKEK